jgi:hypothetical protein
MKYNPGYIPRLLHQLAHIVHNTLRRQIDRTLDVATYKVVVADVDDEVVLAGLAIALDDLYELLMEGIIKSG